jgi:hypothetical protein
MAGAREVTGQGAKGVGERGIGGQGSSSDCGVSGQRCTYIDGVQGRGAPVSPRHSRLRQMTVHRGCAGAGVQGGIRLLQLHQCARHRADGGRDPRGDGPLRAAPRDRVEGAFERAQFTSWGWVGMMHRCQGAGTEVACLRFTQEVEALIREVDTDDVSPILPMTWCGGDPWLPPLPSPPPHLAPHC